MEVVNIGQAVVTPILKALGAYVYGNVAQVSSLKTGLIIVIADLADSIFCLIAQQNKKESHKLAAYIFTSPIIAGIEIIALRYFELIAGWGACLLAGVSLYDYYGRICKLKDLEPDLQNV